MGLRAYLGASKCDLLAGMTATVRDAFVPSPLMKNGTRPGRVQ